MVWDQGVAGSNPVFPISSEEEQLNIMEDYPSLAEGNGLENRQAGQTAQEFESLILLS
ncbi:hypothetical protein FC40_GL000042 [Ligilactobacillus hayakitensis DSM 18933 = JCM 14209]|uniref:Uncharacterized protein n=1 Tax=Ligilactobacillus hayakitensis DSM 18933 = JCM 14209 TaxID=1423755 RepID=A0A0R1WNJ9_9LACO|nr:hypothetical protein FC40_GL000042 [Ligilactobacillus hayakitensis DSM 18933 = JCM 14209]